MGLWASMLRWKANRRRQQPEPRRGTPMALFVVRNDDGRPSKPEAVVFHPPHSSGRSGLQLQKAGSRKPEKRGYEYYDCMDVLGRRLRAPPAAQAPVREHQKRRGGAGGNGRDKADGVQGRHGGREEGSGSGSRGVQDADDAEEDADVAAEDTDGDAVRASTVQRCHTIRRARPAPAEQLPEQNRPPDEQSKQIRVQGDGYMADITLKTQS
ncbi:unnamed protein product [Miscanthus lutarioriparius]|uniref:Uncharacterized protein n=1 Tax=Miscanthus lutarioriparius TaxID=422564 RepID=A0A811MM34_9POAL|nr:unnamed protein product [Miscanthus lutarioriparius]